MEGNYPSPRSRPKTFAPGQTPQSVREIGQHQIPVVHERPSPRAQRPDPQHHPVANPGREPLKLIERERVEYFSATHKTWVPAVIMKVNEETGAVTIDLKPNTFIHRNEQNRLRTRTVPTLADLANINKILKDGVYFEKCEDLFKQYADKKTDKNKSSLLLSGYEAKRLLCLELDKMLGVSGTICDLSQRSNINVDEFATIFFSLMWTIHKTYASALNHEQCIKASKCDPARAYAFKEELGRGTYGTVWLCTCKKSNMTRAIKVIPGPSSEQALEIRYLLELDHPHIVKLHAHYDWRQQTYLVMDYCGAGELNTLIKKHKRQNNSNSQARSSITESFTGDILRQCLLAIAHVHARGVMHLDLKPQNVMLMHLTRTMPPSRNAAGPFIPVDERAHAMVIDLGVAQFFRPGVKERGPPVGTPLYMAPEMWTGNLSPKADVFSLGVILYEMLSLHWPFVVHPGPGYEEARNFWKDQIAEPSLPWHRLQHASKNAAKMCRKMMDLDQLNRPRAQKCLEYAFIESLSKGEDGKPLGGKKSKSYAKRMNKFPSQGLLYKSVAFQIARCWPPNQLPSIKELFDHLVNTSTGLVAKTEVIRFLELQGFSAHHAADAADNMDMDQDGDIDWSEFVAACINLGSDELEGDLKKIFKMASNGRNHLTKENVASMLVSPRMTEKDKQDMVLEFFPALVERQCIDWDAFRHYFQDSASDTIKVCPSDGTHRDNQRSPRNDQAQERENAAREAQAKKDKAEAKEREKKLKKQQEEQARYKKEKMEAQELEKQKKQLEEKLVQERERNAEQMAKMQAEIERLMKRNQNQEAKEPENERGRAERRTGGETLRSPRRAEPKDQEERKYDELLGRYVTYEEMVKHHAGRQSYWDSLPEPPPHQERRRDPRCDNQYVTYEEMIRQHEGRGSYWDRLQVSEEENLKRLAEMGFVDRERNKKVLQEYRNQYELALAKLQENQREEKMKARRQFGRRDE